MNDKTDIRCEPGDAAGLMTEIKRRDRIINALMNQVQRNLNNPDNDFSLLQTTFMLEEEVRERTAELAGARDALTAAKEELEKANLQLEERVADRTVELMQQLHFVRELIEAIPSPVFYKDVEGRYLGCNAAFEEVTGIPGCELIGKTIPEVFPSSSAREYAKADRELIEHPGVQIYETRIRFANGETRDVMLHKATFTRADGATGGIVGVMLDITERKRLEEQLREVQKMEAMGKLAGGIAHDFNNLMTIINGYGELLHTALENDAAACEKVEQILRAGDQANSLTRQLLAFTRRQILQPRLLDLRSVVADMGSMLRRVVSEDVELLVLRDPNPCLINADSGQIQQVILNLLLNARDATPKGGRITLEVTNIAESDRAKLPQQIPQDRYVRLAVTDTGHGMSAATRARIFEPFFTTKEVGKGTGMGLATVFGIVQQSGGYIHVESEVGQGASFYVYFRHAEGSISEEGKPVALRLAHGSETILVVEDQEGLRNLTCEILSRNGYRVLAAADGSEALQLAAQNWNRIDLMITDLVMPKMGGREVAEKLPAYHPETTIMYMSGYADDVDQLISQGHDFIDKPFSPDTLLRKVREIFDRRAGLRRSA